MIQRTRREFLQDVGTGVVVASIGAGLAAELGFSPAFADEGPERLTFGQLEPLVSLMQETPPARLVPLVLVVLILLSGWWGPWSYIPLIGWLLDKCIDLVLAFVLFKVLSHEARRYRETAPDLPPMLRL